MPESYQPVLHWFKQLLGYTLGNPTTPLSVEGMRYFLCPDMPFKNGMPEERVCWIYSTNEFHLTLNLSMLRTWSILLTHINGAGAKEWSNQVSTGAPKTSCGPVVPTVLPLSPAKEHRSTPKGVWKTLRMQGPPPLNEKTSFKAFTFLTGVGFHPQK